MSSERGERARQVRAEVTSERDARAQRDMLLADMMADALVTSALNPYWLWSSVGAPPAYCRYLGPAPLTLLDWFRNVGVKLLPPSVNRALGLKSEAASAAAAPRGLSPAPREARAGRQPSSDAETKVFAYCLDAMMRQ